jgi:hypothetical protein
LYKREIVVDMIFLLFFLWGIGVLLAYDVALKVHAHFDGLARLRGCTAPDAIAVFFELANAAEAMPRSEISLDPP